MTFTDVGSQNGRFSRYFGKTSLQEQQLAFKRIKPAAITPITMDKGTSMAYKFIILINQMTPIGLEFLVSDTAQPYSRSAAMSASSPEGVVAVATCSTSPFTIVLCLEEISPRGISWVAGRFPINKRSRSAQYPLLSLQTVCAYERTRYCSRIPAHAVEEPRICSSHM